MRITNKAAASSLPVPGGLKPSLIGKLVVVQLFKKKDGVILHETLTKQVGVLKTYTLSSNEMYFTLDGGVNTPVFYKGEVVEFILYEGS